MEEKVQRIRGRDFRHRIATGMCVICGYVPALLGSDLCGAHFTPADPTGSRRDRNGGNDADAATAPAGLLPGFRTALSMKTCANTRCQTELKSPSPRARFCSTRCRCGTHYRCQRTTNGLCRRRGCSRVIPDFRRASAICCSEKCAALVAHGGRSSGSRQSTEQTRRASLRGAGLLEILTPAEVKAALLLDKGHWTGWVRKAKDKVDLGARCPACTVLKSGTASPTAR
jgi:hypothetical protein